MSGGPYQRQQGEPPGRREEDRERHQDLEPLLEQPREGGVDDRLGLVDVGDDPLQQLPAPHLREELEVERHQVAEQLGAEVAHHPFLHRHRELGAGVVRRVLEEDGGDEESHDPEHRLIRGGPREDRVEQSFGEAFEAGARAAEPFGGPEQVLEERDDAEDHRPVHHRRDEIEQDRQPIPAAVGTDLPDQPAPDAHRFPRRVVSSAIGRITSSGVTPPWRNAPRYRAWYSRSLVGYTKK
jgi:hypothetical protein